MNNLVIKKLISFKEFFEINVMTLNRTNITWVVVSLAVIYFFMTQVLMYDLYDLRLIGSMTDLICDSHDL